MKKLDSLQFIPDIDHFLLVHRRRCLGRSDVVVCSVFLLAELLLSPPADCVHAPMIEDGLDHLLRRRTAISP